MKHFHHYMYEFKLSKTSSLNILLFDLLKHFTEVTAYFDMFKLFKPFYLILK